MKAGKSIKRPVVRGVDKSAFETMDSGTTRTAADVFTIKGEPYAYTLASAARLLWKYENGGLISGKNHPSTPEKIATLEKNPSLRQFVAETAKANRGTRLLPFGFIAFFYHGASRVDPEKATKFVNGIIEGVDLGKTSPIHVLRERLIANRAQTKGTRISGKPLFYLIFRAWQAYRDGKRMTKIQLPKGEFTKDHFTF